MVYRTAFPADNACAMRFESILLRNFQAHEELEVPLGAGITTITGATDVGKSAVLRALRWACLNDFAGDDFIRDGAKEASAIVTVRHGKDTFTIERCKTGRSSGNLYFLGKEEFKAFGMGVPDAIAKILSVNEINFQGQHDSPFWFTMSAPEVSRQLNRVIDLSVIDTSLGYIVGRVKQARDEKNITEERLKQAREELEELERQEARIQEFDKLLDLDEDWKDIDEDCDRVERFINAIQAYDLENLTAKAEDLEDLYDKAKSYTQAKKDAESLASLVDRLDLKAAQAKGPPPFQPVQKAYEKWQNVDQECEKLASLINSLSCAAQNGASHQRAYEAAEKKFHAQIKGQRCPLCQNKIQ